MILRTKLTWIALVILCFLAGTGLGVLFSLPFDTAKLLADHLARDGGAEQFSVEFFFGWGLALRGLGLVGLGIAALLLIFRTKFWVWIEIAYGWLGRALHRLGQDGKTMIADYPPDRSGMLMVGLITLAAAATTLPILWRPMLHDEAYTFMAFARQPFRYALADYHVPNNHLFHTFWLYLSYHTFGIEPWAVRLPAFLAGMGLIPAIYSLGKRLFSKPTGLVAAALVAASPEVLQYSVTARGYTLVALLTVLLLLLSLYVKNHRNSTAWLLWALTAALGFYSIPVFLYPFGVAVAWLFLALIVNDFQSYRGRIDLLLHLIVSGMVAGLTTFLLYLPVFLHHKTFSVLFGNVFIEKLPWDAFRQTTPIRLTETWYAWINGIPAPVVNILLLGFGLALLLHWKLSNTRVPIPFAAVAWLVPLVLVQEVQLWSKTWFAFNPLVLLWCAAGLVGVVGMLFQWLDLFVNITTAHKGAQAQAQRHREEKSFRMGLIKYSFSIVTGLAIAAILFGSLVYKQSNFLDMNRPGTNEEIALYIQQNLQPEDTIVVSWEDEPMVWYYLLRHQVPEKVFLVRSTSFKRAFVVVGPAYNLTLPEVVADKGADPKYFDLEKAEAVRKIGNSTVYLVPGR
jgi:hypothetical protein